MDHFHSIGILGVAARVERSNRINAASKGDTAEAARLDLIMADYETAIAILQAPPAPMSLCALCASVRKDTLAKPQRPQSLALKSKTQGAE